MTCPCPASQVQLLCLAALRRQLAAGRQLSRLAKEARRAGTVPRPGTAAGLQGRASTEGASRGSGAAAKPVPEARLAEDYVAAREVLGLPDGAIVCVSPGDEERGRLGYAVALDRLVQRR